MVGTYRASEVALGRSGDRHPIEHVFHELKREYGDVVVELGQTGNPEFVDALVDSEPNRLEREFSNALYDRTQGHALFTVELLRTLQERGILVRDEGGAWVLGGDLDWGALPARVEGVLEERISRLSVELRELLTVAAVEGEEFTAEVVARVKGVPAGEVVKTLGQDLERRHRLVFACGLRQLPETRLSRFCFGHSLFSGHLYAGLDEAELAYLHDDVGSALEELYGEHVDEVAAELARHFEKAGRIDKALEYLGLAAGRASSVSAFSDAASLARRALEMIPALQDEGEREVAAIAHYRMLVVATAASSGWAHPEVREIAGELGRRCFRAGDTTGQFWALVLLISHHGNRAEFHALQPLLAELLELAESSGDPLLVMTGHWCHLYLAYAGEPASALGHIEIAESLLDDQIAERYFRVNGFDARPVVPMWIGMALMFMGHLERGALKFSEAVAVADALGNPFSRAIVRGIVGPALVYSGVEAGLALCDECIAIATERGFEEIKLYGMLGRVFEAAARGDPEPNERYIATIEASGYLQALPWCLRLRCSLLLAAGKVNEAVSEIRQARAFLEESGMRLDESGFHRLEGDVAVILGDPGGAERCYLSAIDVAARQQMKPFELEAATALARLWRSQGKTTEARDLLRPVYEWFTEGLDTKPLVEARVLLDELK